MTKSVFYNWMNPQINDQSRAHDFALFVGNDMFETNYRFQYCVKNWTNYLSYINSLELDDTTSHTLALEWRNELMKDWYNYAKEWFKDNKNDTFWRKDLR